MWVQYTKTFCFRDCFDEEIVKGNVEAINRLLKQEQIDLIDKGTKTHGAFITTKLLATGVADSLEVYKSDEDGTWYLNFSYGNNYVASICIDWNLKQINLCFEIEENLETGENVIHSCEIKGFKEYHV